ncbi:MAG TPA: hypothetical protein VKA80_01785, partial [Beijerinckiaceae bacterium]|nr:hypothetical protein [Beijerinckiaceae bacterium]
MAVTGLKVVARTYAGTTAPAMARAILFGPPQNNRGGGKLAPSPVSSCGQPYSAASPLSTPRRIWSSSIDS